MEKMRSESARLVGHLNPCDQLLRRPEVKDIFESPAVFITNAQLTTARENLVPLRNYLKQFEESLARIHFHVLNAQRFLTNTL